MALQVGCCRMCVIALFCPQSLYSAVDDLRGTKADREQLEIEVKEVCTLIASDLLKVGRRL